MPVFQCVFLYVCVYVCLSCNKEDESLCLTHGTLVGDCILQTHTHTYTNKQTHSHPFSVCMCIYVRHVSINSHPSFSPSWSTPQGIRGGGKWRRMTRGEVVIERGFGGETTWQNESEVEGWRLEMNDKCLSQIAYLHRKRFFPVPTLGISFINGFILLMQSVIVTNFWLRLGLTNKMFIECLTSIFNKVLVNIYV